MMQKTVNYAEKIAQSPNRSIYWARVFVDELARCGLTDVCIAPGSRSTPLTLAFAEHPAIRVHSIIDERSAAFFALGLALASGRPAAVVCSSGTATANFHPAIIEARYAQVPLLVLTADRPHELRESGANQTIDQVKMYGDHVLWAVDVALPEAAASALTVRSLRTLADRAYAKANGFEKGPVHLNFPFRKPLEPTPVAGDVQDSPHFHPPDDQPFTVITPAVLSPSDAQIEDLYAVLSQARRGLIVCGPRCPQGAFAAAVAELATRARFTLLADPLSGLRFGAVGPQVFSRYDTYLRVTDPWESPDVLLQFGAMPTSQALDDYMSQSTPDYRIAIAPSGAWMDSNHQLDWLIQAGPVEVCQRLAARFDHAQQPPDPDAQWHNRWRAAEEITSAVLSSHTDTPYFDGWAVRDVTRVMHDFVDGSLVIGNSLAIRHLDQFSGTTDTDIHVYGNRGAAGIDGVVSTALGVRSVHQAAVLDSFTVLVIGDLSFYHDMNGLLAIRRLGLTNITIVLLNNDGGGIFNRLPIKGYEPHFTDLFITPTGLEFAHAAKLYGLQYIRADDSRAFRAALTASLEGSGATLIEVRTDIQQDDARRQAVMAAVRAALADEQKQRGGA